MNEHESEKLGGILEKMGYVETDDVTIANVIVFNTCCIRENAEQRAEGNIGALKKLKKQNKDVIIAVGGCMTQQNGRAESLKKKFPFIDIIFGTHNLADFERLLSKRLETKKSFIEISSDEYSLKECAYVSRKMFPSALVNVMYGCNNFCSYCIVPYVRGRERSRSPENIVNEVKFLVENGFKEITLLGQNVDSYGKDLTPKIDFSDLLSMVNEIDGEFRIRFMSNHPKDVNEKLCKTIANSNKVCNSVHFPIQSGSTKILKDMNRKYTREDCLSKIEMMRSIIPNVYVTTDVMVGFPGETEQDFQDTLDIIEKVKFNGAFTFVYSPRKGTKAAEMPNQIDEKIKKERIIKLVDLQNSINFERAKESVSKTVTVLFENFNESEGLLNGRDEGGKVINVLHNENLVGKFKEVKITKANGITLYGELV